MDQESEALIPDRAGCVVPHLALQLPAVPCVEPTPHRNATLHLANENPAALMHHQQHRALTHIILGF